MKRKWIIWIVVIVIIIIIAAILIKKYGKDEYGQPNITLEQKLNRNMQVVRV